MGVTMVETEANLHCVYAGISEYSSVHYFDSTCAKLLDG